MEEAKEGKSSKYPGVYWRMVKSHDGRTLERKYYIIYRKGGRAGKKVEEPIGRASEGMTEALASRKRAARLAGIELSNVEHREKEKQAKQAKDGLLTLNALWLRYKEENAQKSCIKSDNNRYDKHIKPILGDRYVSELTTNDITNFRQQIEAKKSMTKVIADMPTKEGNAKVKTEVKLSAQTVKHILTLVRRILNYGLKKGVISVAQPVIFDIPKVDNKGQDDMDEARLKAYLKAIDEEPDQDAAAFLRLALYTGMRKGAIIALKWEDIDFDKGFIRLRAESAKNGKTAYLPMNELTRKVLQSIARKSDYVFPGKNGGPREDFRRIARRVRDKAGLPKSFRPLHGLRHTYASVLASSGLIDLYQLQKLLTHSSSQMTQQYAHLHDEAMKKAADKAGDIFDKLM